MNKNSWLSKNNHNHGSNKYIPLLITKSLLVCIVNRNDNKFAIIKSMTHLSRELSTLKYVTESIRGSRWTEQFGTQDNCRNEKSYNNFSHKNITWIQINKFSTTQNMEKVLTRGSRVSVGRRSRETFVCPKKVNTCSQRDESRSAVENRKCSVHENRWYENENSISVQYDYN